MIVITGATGNTGSVVAEQLLAAGEKVRVVGRSAERLQRFVEKGAEAFVGDVRDADAMAQAFAGAAAAYVMIPPDPKAENLPAYQDSVIESLAAALEKSGVKYAVALSSIGADKTDKTGPVKGCHRLELRLNRIAGLNVLHLRAGFFMENLFQYIGLIKSMGMLAGTVRGEVAMPWIATRDIGAVAAEALLKRGFAGSQTRELLGARDISMNEVATIVGKAIGKERLGYSQFPAMLVKPAMKQLGLSADFVDQFLEMNDAVNSGCMKALEPRSASNTTPTTLEEFVEKEFLPRYQAG
jgi:uncharacterized protein YbjT (DUF2867 family)